MKITRTKKTEVVITGITNEALACSVTEPAIEWGCKWEYRDQCTKVIVTGTEKNISKYFEKV